MPFPFAVVAAAIGVSTTTVVAGTAAAAAATAIALANKSDDDDGYYESSGPSAEELQEQALEKLLEEAQHDFASFFSSYKNVRIISDSDDLVKIWHTTEAIFSSTHQEKLISRDDLKKIRSNATEPGVWEEITSDSLEYFCDYTSSNVRANCNALEIQKKINAYFDVLYENIDNVVILPSDNAFSTRKKYNKMFQPKRVLDSIAKDYKGFQGYTPFAAHERPILNAYAKKDPEFQEYFMQFENLQNIKATNPRIAVCGLLKAGKSSLLNMLTGNYADEYFKTARVRETVATKTLTYNGIDYVDTPGLDAPESDEAESWKTFISADIILFVHELGSELKAEEIKILERLYNENKECVHSIVFVFTYADNFANSEKELQRIENVICKQITNTIYITPIYFSVSNTSYRKGILENKKNLSEKMGRVQLLTQYIASQKSQLLQDANRNRKKQKEIVFSKMHQCINKASSMSKQSLDNMMSAELKKYQEILTRVERLKELYTRKRNDIIDV